MHSDGLSLVGNFGGRKNYLGAPRVKIIWFPSTSELPANYQNCNPSAGTHHGIMFRIENTSQISRSPSFDEFRNFPSRGVKNCFRFHQHVLNVNMFDELTAKPRKQETGKVWMEN